MTTEEKNREFERINVIEQKVIEKLAKNGEDLRGCRRFCINEMRLKNEDGDTYYNDGLTENYTYYYMTKKQLIKLEVHYDGKKLYVDICRYPMSISRSDWLTLSENSI